MSASVDHRPGGFPTSEARRRASGEPPARTYIFVPYAEIAEAKDLGASFDVALKHWFVASNLDIQPFDRWRHPLVPMSDAEIMHDLEAALTDMGLVLAKPLEMDGAWQDTFVSTSSSTKALKGAYKAALMDGKASGFIKNFDTGEDSPWRPSGLTFDSEQWARQRSAEEHNASHSPHERAIISTPRPPAVPPERKSSRNNASLEESRLRAAAQLSEQYAAVAARCTEKWEHLQPADSTHPYLLRKGVAAFGLRMDGHDLVTPIRDAKGAIRSLQHITEEGEKRYVKDGQKSGNFHIFGDINAGKTVLLGEGYATCASIHMATQLPVVQAFDGGNLAPVLRSLGEQLAGRTLVICGDDDVLTRGRIVATIAKVVASAHAQARIGLPYILEDEIEVDGVTRRLEAKPDCSVTLRYEPEVQGVQRVVGELVNNANGQRIPIKIVNGGREKALAAAAEFGAQAVFPRFTSLSGGPTDFNDLHAREGLAVVRKQIGFAMLSHSHATPELTPDEIAHKTMGADVTVTSAKKEGRYVGTVVGNTTAHSIQDVGRKAAIKHNLDHLDKVPQVGKPARIEYQDGAGRVGVGPPSLSRDRGTSR